jgi:hypothetical protein
MHSWRWLTGEQPAAAAAVKVAVSCYLVQLRQLWCVFSGFESGSTQHAQLALADS